jgi:two-component system sensor histidine kinase/response regulator
MINVSILHVEDNELVAGVTRELLHDQGWRVETCADGNTALVKIAANAHYDLLLIDYDLPDVNGLELVHRVRKLAHRSQIPVVMFSASPVEAAAHDAGADVFLRKPQDVGSLVETITSLIADRQPAL